MSNQGSLKPAFQDVVRLGGYDFHISLTAYVLPLVMIYDFGLEVVLVENAVQMNC